MPFTDCQLACEELASTALNGIFDLNGPTFLRELNRHFRSVSPLLSISRYENTMGRGERKTSPSQVENQGVCSRRASNKMKWEDTICSCWRLEGRRQLPMRESFSGDQAPLHRTSLSLSDKWPFRCLSFRACSGSILSLQFIWRRCNLLSEGPGVSVASTYCWRAVSASWETLTGLKGTCFHQSVSSPILHARTAEHSRYKLWLSTNIHF